MLNKILPLPNVEILKSVAVVILFNSIFVLSPVRLTPPLIALAKMPVEDAATILCSSEPILPCAFKLTLPCACRVLFAVLCNILPVFEWTLISPLFDFKRLFNKTFPAESFIPFVAVTCPTEASPATSIFTELLPTFAPLELILPICWYPPAEYIST